jgi:hypothetical protein
MGLLKTRSLTLLLLALLLPLQSFAWVNCSSPDTASAAAHLHCGDPAAHTGDIPQHHHCGSCCATAVAATPLRVSPAPAATPGIALPAHRPLLKIALDRLDRPPRSVIR